MQELYFESTVNDSCMLESFKTERVQPGLPELQEVCLSVTFGLMIPPFVSDFLCFLSLTGLKYSASMSSLFISHLFPSSLSNSS